MITLLQCYEGRYIFFILRLFHFVEKNLNTYWFLLITVRVVTDMVCHRPFGGCGFKLRTPKRRRTWLKPYGYRGIAG